MTDAAKTELLAALAEKVMGLDPITEKEWFRIGGRHKNNPDRWQNCLVVSDHGLFLVEAWNSATVVFNPLTDTAQAMELLEKWARAKKDRCFSIMFEQGLRIDQQWEVDCESCDADTGEWAVFARTFSEAATLAVARAVGIEVGE